MELTIPFFKKHRFVDRLLILTGVTLLATSWIAATTQASNSTTWDPAGPIPFATGALKTNGWNTSPVSVSCASVGNCTAGGEFHKSDDTYAGFVVSSTNGIWGEAEEVVFDGSVSGPIDYVTVTSVSCVSPGNCAAVGKFLNAEAFVMTSSNGVWGQATRVTFPDGVRNATPFERLEQVSCTSVGNCTAVGNFRNATGTTGGPNEQAEAFTVSLTNGVWGQARPVVFANGVTQNSAPRAYFRSVSCSSPGNCTAVGRFRNSSPNGNEMFVTTSTNGVWSDATPVVFTSGVQPTQTSDWYQNPMSISCASAGNCAVVGGFTNTAGDFEAFTLTSTNGVWGQATPVAFATGVQYQNPYAELKSVSCPTVGNCVAAGSVKTNLGTEAFTTSLTNGVWGDGRLAIFPPNSQYQTLVAEFRSISCASVGNCTAGGYFRHQNGNYLAQTMTSTNGVWDVATPAVFGAGVQDPSSQDEMIYSVSCASAGNCAAVGYFTQASLGYRALAMMSTGSALPETPATPTTVAESGGAITSTTVTNTSVPATSSSNNAKVLPDTGSQSGLMLLLVGVGLLSLGVAIRRRFS